MRTGLAQAEYRERQKASFLSDQVVSLVLEQAVTPAIAHHSWSRIVSTLRQAVKTMSREFEKLRAEIMDLKRSSGSK